MAGERTPGEQGEKADAITERHAPLYRLLAGDVARYLRKVPIDVEALFQAGLIADRKPFRNGNCGAKAMSSLRKDGKPRKRNRHPAVCFWCHRELAPGEGCIEYSPKKGAWTAFCVRLEIFEARNHRHRDAPALVVLARVSDRRRRAPREGLPLERGVLLADAFVQGCTPHVRVDAG